MWVRTYKGQSKDVNTAGLVLRPRCHLFTAGELFLVQLRVALASPALCSSQFSFYLAITHHRAGLC